MISLMFLQDECWSSRTCLSGALQVNPRLPLSLAATMCDWDLRHIFCGEGDVQTRCSALVPVPRQCVVGVQSHHGDVLRRRQLRSHWNKHMTTQSADFTTAFHNTRHNILFLSFSYWLIWWLLPNPNILNLLSYMMKRSIRFSHLRSWTRKYLIQKPEIWLLNQ